MAANIKLILSGGSSNTNPNLSLGGVISSASGAVIETSNVTLNNLFDNVSKMDNINQVVNYRCIYIKNTGDELFASASVFLVGTTAADIRLAPAVVTVSGTPTPGTLYAAKNIYAETITSEFGSGPSFDPPLAGYSGGTTGITLSQPSELSPLLLPDLAPGEFTPIWIKRTPNNIVGSGTITDIIGLVVRGVQ